MTSTLSGLGVVKSFGGTQALSGVDLQLRSGRIHALVGENGAGKSTLTKILAGLEQPTSGALLMDGEPIELSSRSDALRRGIGLVPQQLSLNPALTLVDNLAVVDDSRLVRRRRAEQRLGEVQRRTGLSIFPRRRVGELALAQRQFAELSVALACGARFLLLDEPTSALGPFETAGLFAQVKALAAAGTGVLLITHRIDEVRDVADEATVLRGGHRVLHAAVADVTDDELVRAMVGAMPPRERTGKRVPGESRLSLTGVSTRRDGGERLKDVTLEVRSGEIVGVIGVAGNGQRELADVAAGFATPSAGRVRAGGTDISGAPDRAFAAGVRFVPEERLEGLLPDQPLTRSVALAVLDQPGVIARRRISWAQVTRITDDIIRRRDVRPPVAARRAAQLSGGNQQKLLVGRELSGEPRVVVAHGPTQGLDLHAAAAVRRALVEAAERGAAVLLISADTDEVHEIADRIVVLSKGRVSDAFDVADLDVERLGRAMAGVTPGAAS